MALFEVEKLEKIYQQGDVKTPALQGVSFNIKEGEFVAIMGPSGSGKSTLLHILGFLDTQTHGTFHFDGKSFNDRTEEEVAKVRNSTMGFVFQAFNLLPRTTVLDNVLLPLLYSSVKKSEWNKRAESAIEAVGLSHRKNYDTSRLSGGERQRAAIARALVNNPKVIFADEPTGNLDSKSGKTIMEILQQLNESRGHTIILVTHETYTAEHAQRILHMLDGKLEKDLQVRSRHKAKEHFEK